MRFLIIFVLCVWSQTLSSQSILNSLVTLNYSNTKAKTIFQDISKQTGCIFSYSDFQDDKKLSLRVEKLALRNVIPIIESELQIRIIVNEKYLIVKARDQISELCIEGTILNNYSEEPINDASVFAIKNKVLANTDERGHFSLKIPNNVHLVRLQVAKENFIDTSVLIIASKSQNINIYLRSFPRQTIAELDSISNISSQVESKIYTNIPEAPDLKELSYNERLWEKKRKKYIDLININDTIFNKFSISLIPPISTNKLLSFHTKNILAVNIIGGNSKGLSGVELGSVYNYAEGDVIGVQLSGVLNAVSEDVLGIQVAGVLNAVKGDSKGVQISGVANINDKTTTGLQISGIFQSSHTVRGLQLTGVYNQSAINKGGQISGLINKVDSSFTMFQIAGLYNRALNVQGAQISGFINVCDTLDGIQIGLFNRANHIKKGLAIGLINHVKNGYQKLEISINELKSYQIGYRSGWAPLHFHWFGNINIENSHKRFVQAGLGLATSFPLYKNLSFEGDLNIRRTYDINKISLSTFNMHNQLLLGVSSQIFKKLGLKTGLTLNHFWYDPVSDSNESLSSLITKTIYKDTKSGFHHKLWIGWQVGILFL